MGSFANSLHVKTADAEVVSAAIQKLMVDAGFRVTDDAPDTGTPWATSPDMRALCTFGSHSGWSSAVDSDMMDAIAPKLSRCLDTYAIQFMVNDSDAWLYELFYKGDLVDEFDSMRYSGYGGEDEYPTISAEAVEKAGGVDRFLGNLQKTLSVEIDKIKREMPANAHADRDDAQTGTPTPEDALQRMRKGQELAKRMLRVVDKTMAGMGVTTPKGRKRRHKPDLRSHLEKLRPILPPGVSDKRVLVVLGKQAIIAEHVLAEFLELIGVQPFFSNLSYEYMWEWDEAALLAEDIHLTGHLKFKTDSAPGTRHGGLRLL